MLFWATLDFHFEWVVLQVDVVNSFKIDFHRVIFQKLFTIKDQLFQIIPFIRCFFAPIALSFI
jgi:hypothetical protein